MTLEPRTDCTVLLVGPSHDSYRVVNEMLRSLGHSVMWTRDAGSAKFLLQARDVWLVLCDTQTLTVELRKFLSGITSGGTRHLALPLPSGSADMERHNNRYAHKQLLCAVIGNADTAPDQLCEVMQCAVGW